MCKLYNSICNKLYNCNNDFFAVACNFSGGSVKWLIYNSVYNEKMGDNLK